MCYDLYNLDQSVCFACNVHVSELDRLISMFVDAGNVVIVVAHGADVE